MWILISRSVDQSPAKDHTALLESHGGAGSEVSTSAGDDATTAISKNSMNVCILCRLNILNQYFCLLWQFFYSLFSFKEMFFSFSAGIHLVQVKSEPESFWKLNLEVL